MKKRFQIGGVGSDCEGGSGGPPLLSPAEAASRRFHFGQITRCLAPAFLLFPCVSTAFSGELATNRPDSRETSVPWIQAPLGRLPGVDELPVQKELPDVLVANDGARVTTLGQWKQRRVEMRRILEYYAVGQMPPAPGNVTGTETKSATVLNGTVRYRLVHLTFGPRSELSLNIGIFTPAKGALFPAIIYQGGPPPDAPLLPRLPLGPGQGRGVDALLPATPTNRPAPAAGPEAAFTRPTTAEAVAERFAQVFHRGYALVIYNNNDCAEDTTLREPNGSWAFRTTRFFPAYPGYDWGVLAAWAWGASRIADYLQTDPWIDGTKLIITGASRAGKSSMIAAAFDDRLMGAPVVTGGGGIGAYRIAGARGSESLEAMLKKYPNWFSPNLHPFWGQREKLPFDEHWFLALCAPRPFIALEGDADRISLPEAVRASIEGAKPAYDLYGMPDRLGVHYSHHAHAFTEEDWTALMDFADRYLIAGATSARIANVRDYGAKGDGATIDTQALQRALDARAVDGGGEVVVPAGRYLIGSIQIGTHTLLRLEAGAVLVGSPHLSDYPLTDVRWEGRGELGRRGLIYAAESDHVGIVGPGRIEGAPWGTNAPDGTRNPVVLEAVSCHDVRWNNLTIVQGRHWATHPLYCSNVEIRGLSITSGRDGIDVDSCRDVRISDCDIHSGDDSISLKSGRGLDGARLGRPCENIVIDGCTLADRNFASIGIGSETSGGVRNVRIAHCTLQARTAAIYLKSRIGRAGSDDHIWADDLDVKAGELLRINLATAGNKSTVDDPVDGPAGIPGASDIQVSNARAAVNALVVGTQIPMEKPLRGLVLRHITGSAKTGIHLANMTDVQITDVHVSGLTEPLLSLHEVTRIENQQ
ncbi:MAG TPA: glycoside hydrolase family 28 protein [Opitutaceae bacterium]